MQEAKTGVFDTPGPRSAEFGVAACNCLVVSMSYIVGCIVVSGQYNSIVLDTLADVSVPTQRRA